MRLAFRVLFLQGWLIRERFPDAFPLKQPRTTPDRFMFAAVILVSAVGIVDAARGHWTTAVPLVALGVAWILHHAFWLRLDTLLRWDELWLSVVWGTPMVMEGTFVALVIIGVLDRDWILTTFAFLFGLAFLGTYFLYTIQRRFLFFRDGLAETAAASSLNGGASCALDGNVWLDTYWRLPQRVLSQRKGRRHVY